MANDIEDQTTPLNHSSAAMTDLNKDPDWRALGRKIPRKRSGRSIRNYSIVTFIGIVVNTAIYVGFTAKNMKGYIFLAGSSLAKVNFLYVTLATLLVPWGCKLSLTELAAKIAEMFISEQAYSAENAFFLVAVYLRMNLDLKQYKAVLRSSERGVRTVAFIRLVGDYMVQLSVPFFSLALVYKVKEDSCWMGYEWEWLLLGLLWPSLWTVGILITLMKFWSSQGFVSSGEISMTQGITRAAVYLKVIIQEGGGDWSKGDWTKVTGKWKLGCRLSERSGEEEPELYVGLVREEQCVSLRELFSAIEEDDQSVGGGKSLK
ncbi:hypothetical protein K458DRAFT_414078 [Lentithecium fluviatile CBS 122367]|uniref:Uncharacterized protein n=1 Tax=Lentithecium fluviatile CBS 122367 TaxID=1168545 RepID=A0A6G1JDU4_9PLEO|nr:hypothetical protein K458DRAFT_414078 [Lentithecium fluviatile CBS 122367]